MDEFITRRKLLAAALTTSMAGSALDAGNQGTSQAQARSRTRTSIDFDWKFTKSDPGGAHLPEFDDKGWRAVDLPHDWSIEGPFNEQEPTGGPGGYLPTGIGWYRKRLRIPEAARERRVWVEFDGVYQNSQVWINGSYLGTRPFGYIGFGYDLTPFLRAGVNVLAVRVDNSHQPNSRWYSGSGIYRHTWLVLTNPVHIARWGTFVTTPRLAEPSATVRIRTRVRNETTASQRCLLRSLIVDGGGQNAGKQETPQVIPHGEEYEFSQDVVIQNPLRWTIGRPTLYALKSSLHIGATMVDDYDTPFGIREVTFDADRGFLLNGEALKLNGVCLHHEAGAVGAAVPERVWERRLEILKEMGSNAIRTSHNPPTPELLDLCDRMGFVVMAEAFDEWRVGKGQIGPYGYSLYFDDWHERDIIDFVHRDRNHPSVVMWSAGNEIPDQTHPGGIETARELVGIFHREDPTRPVTAACDQISAEPKAAPPAFLDALDIVGYNYVDRWRDRREKYYSVDRHANPARRFIGTESSGMSGARGDYQWLLPGAAPSRFGYESNTRLDTEQLWKFVRTYDYVAGDFMWTGIDYLGESHWPSRSATPGVLDTCGFKKDSFYFYQSQWTDKPMLYLFPHWNWPGREGQFIPVMCYTNCDTVELFVNGRSAGVKGFEFPRLGMEKEYGTYPARARALRTTNDLHLAWDIPYRAGTLKAVGYKNGNAAVETEVATTGEPAAVLLRPDRDKIKADRRDVVHVTVEVWDAQGRTVPDAANDIDFQVQGEGILIGVDNGDPQNHASFKASRGTLFHGLCLAIVQATGQAGSIEITAASPGLTSHKVTVETGI